MGSCSLLHVPIVQANVDVDAFHTLISFQLSLIQYYYMLSRLDRFDLSDCNRITHLTIHYTTHCIEKGKIMEWQRRAGEEK